MKCEDCPLLEARMQVHRERYVEQTLGVVEVTADMRRLAEVMENNGCDDLTLDDIATEQSINAESFYGSLYELAEANERLITVTCWGTRKKGLPFRRTAIVCGSLAVTSEEREVTRRLL